MQISAAHHSQASARSSRSVGCATTVQPLSRMGYGLQQRTHLLGSASSHLSQCHGHNHRHSQRGACLHDFQAADIVANETVHLIHPAENPFRSTAPIVGFPPTASAMWGRRKYAPIVIFEFDAHRAPVVQCPAATLFMAFPPTFALEITDCRRTPILQGIATLLKALKIHLSTFAGLRTLAVHHAGFTIQNIVHALAAIELARDRFAGVVVAILLFRPP